MPGAQRIPRPPEWREGGPAPWAHLPPGRRQGISLDDVRAAVASLPPGDPTRTTPPELPSTNPVPAAVLAALYADAGSGEATIVLTRRAAHLRSHTGEIAFPGGRLEPGEAPLDAALREAREEVALDPPHMEIVGTLTPLQTLSSSSSITAFVGLLPERPAMTASPAEVEAILEVALADLLADGVFREERWTIPSLGVDRPVAFFDLPTDIVWGATGRMLLELLTAVVAVRS